MKKYLFEIGENFIIKRFKGNTEEAFEQAMEHARALHKALKTPIRFYPLTDESATVITTEK